MTALKNTSVRIEQDGISTRPTAGIAFIVTMITVVLFAAPQTTHAAPAPAPHGLPTPSQIETNISDQGNAGFMNRQFQNGMAEFKAGNHEAAVNLWELAAQQGHLYAQYNLGIAYAKGLGTRADIPRAIHWWREAAIQGNTDAQYNLGALYAEGNGIEKNIAEATIWWSLAAQGGDAAAQYNLGLLLARGDGLPQDVERAIGWWQKSAAQGFQHAIRALETLKNHGVSIQTSQP